MIKMGMLVSGFIMGIQATAWAGVIFLTETTFPNRAEMPPQAGSMMIEGNNLKMTVGGMGNAPSTVIYRGDREEILLINHADHTWQAMDKATMVSLGRHMNPVMQQMQTHMENALKNMPPERRAMMENMLARQGVNPGQSINPGMMGRKVEMQVKKTSETQSINNYPCVKYEVWQEGQKVAEHWVTDWNRIEGAQGAQDVFQDMAAFSREVWQGTFPGSGGPVSLFEALGTMEGFPVLTKMFSDGKTVTESRLMGVQEKPASGQEFEPPKDYVKKEFLPKHVPSPAGH
jgi:hypothetical protein